MHKIIKNDSVCDENDSAVLRHPEETADERFAARARLENSSQENMAVYQTIQIHK